VLRRGDHGELEQTPELSDVEHVGFQGDAASMVDAVVAEATREAEQGVDLPHPSPGELGLEQSVRELADGDAVASGFASEEVEVAKGIGGLVLGKVAAIDGALTGWFPRLGLDEHVVVVEANGGAVSPGAELLADEVGGERVQSFGNLSEVVAADLGLAPEGGVVRLGRSREKYASFFGPEVLEGQSLGGAVPTHPVVLEAPCTSMSSGLLQVVKTFTGKTIVPNGAHGALDPRFVTWSSHACGVNEKPSSLGVFAKGAIEPGTEGVGFVDDRLGVIDDQNAEDPRKKLPSGFTGFDSLFRGLLENGINEAVARTDGGEDESAEPTPATEKVWPERAHPAGIELQLLTRLAVDHRQSGRVGGEAQFLDGEPV
jgi:hypothetical protein